MAIDIYAYRDYKTALQEVVSSPRNGRGYQGRLAKAAGCQPSFLSKVLNGPIHLTPEHAAGIASFWHLADKPLEYFLELVHLARAGTPLLRDVHARRIRRLKKEHDALSEKLALPPLSEPAVQAFYYSSWYVSAVHILLSIPHFQSTERLAERLGLSPQVVENILFELSRTGLAKREKKGWKVGDTRIHTPRDSAFSMSHHANWRQRAMADVYHPGEGSVHYSGLHSLSIDDAERLRLQIVEFLSEAQEMVVPSACQTAVCLNIDLFTV